MKALRQTALLALLICLSGYLTAHAQGSCYRAIPLQDESNKPLPIAPVCKVVEENLNEFCDQPPMVCEFKIAPKLQDRIQLPNWRPVVVTNWLAFIEGIIKAQWTNPYISTAPDSVWRDKRPGFANALSSKSLSISQASLDLYQTKDVGTYYRVDLGNCKERNKSALSAERGLWNSPLASAPIEVIPSAKTIAALLHAGEPLGHFGVTGDLVRVDGRLYTYLMSGHIDNHNSDPGPGNALYLDEGIHVSVDGRPRFHTRQVCEITYQARQ